MVSGPSRGSFGTQAGIQPMAIRATAQSRSLAPPRAPSILPYRCEVGVGPFSGTGIPGRDLRLRSDRRAGLARGRGLGLPESGIPATPEAP